MTLLRLKITLREVKPLIWREVLLSPKLTLAQAHSALQAVMGWEDAHAHRFVCGKRSFSDPKQELDDNSTDERKVQIGELLRTKGDLIFYEYDFGDRWVHQIRCEELLESEQNTQHLFCTDGARACPPEDSGGPYGYAELLEILGDKSHPEYEDMRDWVGPRFAPEAFSIDKTNAELRRLFPKLRS